MFIRKGAFIKIEYFKILTKRFPFSILGGGEGCFEQKTEQTSLRGGGCFIYFKYILVFYLI